MLLPLTLLYLTISVASTTPTTPTLFDFKLNDISGKEIDFAGFRGKTLLLVNVASQCGQTDAHYKSLKRLHEILSWDGKFEILAFPCNDFGEQEPWDEKEIEEFVRGHFKAEFLLFPKVKILGVDRHPFWAFVGESSQTTPTWNFSKYLYDQDGKFVKFWDSNTSVEAIFDVVKGVIEKGNSENNKVTGGGGDEKEEL